MRIAIASMRSRPHEFQDDEHLVALLQTRGADASVEAWDDEGVDWRGFDLVVIRSTWDYSGRRHEFLTWADGVGDRLHNPPPLVRWNSDKRYLRDLAGFGIPVVETSYVAPGEPAPVIERESVIKPTVSAGARDTGRFWPDQAQQAADLIAAIGASGRTAMVQPYLASVDTQGEIAIVFVDGEPTHALRKRAVLRPGEIAPVRDDEVGAAEAMYDPDLVGADTPTSAELASAAAVVAEVTRRFGAAPLYARVDQLRDSGGRPVLLELEAVEPALYFEHGPGSAHRLADAIVSRATPRYAGAMPGSGA
jgi:hypothetical protein